MILLFHFLAKCCPASPSSLVCVATSFSPCNGLALMQAFLVLNVSWWRSSLTLLTNECGKARQLIGGRRVEQDRNIMWRIQPTRKATS